MTYPEDFYLGDRRLIGQHAARKRLTKVLQSDRLGHAYLFTGNPGVGKTATALAFAEAIQGIDHLSDLRGKSFSRKSTWLNHPDIHVFFPIIKLSGDRLPKAEDMRALLTGLNEDPYASLDITSLESSTEEAKRKKSFYPIEYFREEIRKKAFLTPNEGRLTVIIVTRAETLRPDAANAFLKALEEPANRVLFILTSDRPDALLPTILSRCQIVPFTPLSTEDIQTGLVQHYQISTDDAQYLARISNGSFSVSRVNDVELFRALREYVLDFFRAAYSIHNGKLLPLVTEVAKNHNVEGLLRFLNLMEVFLHDVALAAATVDSNLFTQVDQADVILKFASTIQHGGLPSILDEIQRCRILITQNVNARLTLLVLGMRCHRLLRGSHDQGLSTAWLHAPTYYSA